MTQFKFVKDKGYKPKSHAWRF